LDTLIDLSRQVISATLQAEQELPSGSSFGGLRGGYARLTSSAAMLRRYSFVSGVQLSGTFPVRNGALQPATIRISGRQAAPGTLERARREDKPLLVSSGYSSCHWCHVMERESFEDARTAALMNDSFVCVKVDREERPDVDALYMEAVQGMTGQGGWPLNVF